MGIFEDPYFNLFGNYYVSDKRLPFASNNKLLELNVRQDNQQHLEFKTDLEQTLLQATRSLGQNNFMSPNNFHSFVNLVSKSTTLKAGGSVKSFADAFIYRAIAMIEPSEYVTVDAEYGLVGIGVPPSDEGNKSDTNYIPACIIDYRIVVSNDQMEADEILEEGISYLRIQGQSVLPLSVLEPEPGGVNLEQCIPHLAWKMYATAKTLKKTAIRGALTDGFKWILLVLTVELNGVGATYSCSYAFPAMDPRYICTGGRYEDGNDILTGILASWIRRSSEPLSDKDWLKCAHRS